MKPFYYLFLLLSATSIQARSHCGPPFAFFSRNRVGNRELGKILTENETALSQSILTKGELPKKVVVEFLDSSLTPYHYGKIGRIEIEGEPYLIVHNEFGKGHIIDPRSNKVRIYDASTFKNIDRKTLSKETKEPSSVEEKLKEKFCAALPTPFKNPDPKIQKKLDSLAAQLDRRAVGRAYTKYCAATTLGSMGGLFLADSIFYEEDRSDAYSAHRSNFFLGVLLMSFTHTCLSVISPSKATALLATALGTDTLGNIYFELGLGQKEPDGKVVKTDLPDFVSGMAGVAAYLVIGSAIESKLGKKFRDFCGKK